MMKKFQLYVQMLSKALRQSDVKHNNDDRLKLKIGKI